MIGEVHETNHVGPEPTVSADQRQVNGTSLSTRAIPRPWPHPSLAITEVSAGSIRRASWTIIQRQDFPLARARAGAGSLRGTMTMLPAS